MPNKRAVPRIRRRLRVEIAGASTFTVDVSPGGFCTEAMHVLPAGSAVRGKILAANGDIDFEGTVAWAKAGDPRLQLRGRMGVKISSASEEFLALTSARVS